MTNSHVATFARENLPRILLCRSCVAARAADRPMSLGDLCFDHEYAEGMIIAPTPRQVTSGPHALDRTRGSLVRPNQHRAEHAEPARNVVAGPWCGNSGHDRSAATGQDVRARADAPRAGPLGCLELAATDLGAPALAGVMTGDFDMLGLFATRHETSLKMAIRDREFLANFFSVRHQAARPFPKTCGLKIFMATGALGHVLNRDRSMISLVDPVASTVTMPS